jgi:hypothetical protein
MALTSKITFLTHLGAEWVGKLPLLCDYSIWGDQAGRNTIEDILVYVAQVIVSGQALRPHLAQ